MKKYTSVKDYLESLPKDKRAIISKLRATIKKTAPRAKEVISYGMPAFRGNRVFIFYAMFKNHYSIFAPSAVSAFRKELKPYKTAKATINFPLDTPVPVGLVSKIAKFAVKRDLIK